MYNNTEPFYHSISEWSKAKDEEHGITESEQLKLEKRNMGEYISKLEAANRDLQNKNTELEEKLDNYIPRRRVRRVFKQLKTILEEDLKDDNKIYIEKLKIFIQKIEKEGQQMAGQDIKQAIEHLLSTYVPVDSDIDILYADGVPVQILQHVEPSNSEEE